MGRRRQAWLAGALGVAALGIFLSEMFGDYLRLAELVPILGGYLPPALAIASIWLVVDLIRTADLAAEPEEKDRESTASNVAAIVGVVAALIFFGCIGLWTLSWVVPH